MNTRHLILAGAAILMATACSNDREETGAAERGELRLSLTTTFGVEAETRSVTDDASQNSGNFANGEQVAVYLLDNNDPCDGTTGTGWSTYTKPLAYTSDGAGNLTCNPVQVWPKQLHSLNVYGVYPYSAANAGAMTKSGGAFPTYSFTVKADQSAPADYKASDLMLAVPSSGPNNNANPLTQTAEMTSGTVGLTFSHKLSKVIVKLAKSPSSTGITDDALASAKVTIMNTIPTATFSVKDQTAAVDNTVAASDIIARETAADSSDPSTTLYTGKDVAAIIVPQTVAASTQFIKVEIGSDTFLYTLDTAKTFASGSVYTYTITVHKSTITVTSTITAWTDEDSDHIDGRGKLQTP